MCSTLHYVLGTCFRTHGATLLSIEFGAVLEEEEEEGLFMALITERFVINCCLIKWLIKYFSLSVLKLAICHRSGTEMDLIGCGSKCTQSAWIGSASCWIGS